MSKYEMNKYDDTDRDKALNELMVESLDQSVEHLDAHTLSRLNQARHRALAQAPGPRLLGSQWFKVATVAVLLVTVINGWLLFTAPEVQQMNAEDLELLIADDDFELLQDMEFIAWMLEEEHAS